jgi:hypothetical protein
LSPSFPLGLTIAQHSYSQVIHRCVSAISPSSKG